jgi:glutaredoxin
MGLHLVRRLADRISDMRTLWFACLLLFCAVASGFILVRGRAPGDAPDLASLAGEAQAAVEQAATRLSGEPEPGAETQSDAPPATFYRYTDKTGTVRFVSSLAEVPKALRASARPVGNRVQRAAAAPAPKRRQVARAERAAAAPPARNQPVGDHEVVVYTTSWCGWCRKTLAFLDEQGVDYDNRDIEADDAWREELLEKTGRTSIPVVEIDGQLIRGYDPTRMAELLRSS